MRFRLLYIFCTVVSTLGCFALHAQQDSILLDEITFKSGQVIVGRIVEIKHSDYVAFQKTDDWHINIYYMQAVANIRQGVKVAVAGLGSAKRPPFARVLLNEGRVVSGRVLEDQPGQYIRLAISSDSTQNIPASAIRGVEYLSGAQYRQAQAATASAKVPKPYAFKEKGLFVSVNGIAAIGNRVVDYVFLPPPSTPLETEPFVSYGCSATVGVLLCRQLGIGLGAGYDAYNLDDGEEMVSAFVHLRSYLNQRRFAPFFALNAGWGKGLLNDEKGIIEAIGGPMLYPEFGIRLGAKAKINFTVSAGLRMQWAEWLQASDFSIDFERRNVFYHRASLNVGVLF